MLDVTMATEASYASSTMPNTQQCFSSEHLPIIESAIGTPNVMTFPTRSHPRAGFGRPLRKALKVRIKQRRLCKCVVCGERASGMYFGAMVCLPCKSFFIRCTKDGQPQLTCLGEQTCNIDRSNRMRCQFCRYQKCLQAGMMRREKPEVVEPGEGQELCRVCADIANGIHFGVTTCEGCKKFFRRALKEAETYECKFQHGCSLNPRNRNACRLCRYNKCLNVGMSRQAIKMGRPKKLKTEASSMYNTTHMYGESLPLFSGMSLMVSPIKMPPLMHDNGPQCYSHMGYQVTPHSPCGTDSGIESDSGSPPINSPVASPRQCMTSQAQSMTSPLTGMPAQNNCNTPVFPEHIQGNVPASIFNQIIKIEPIDFYDNTSVRESAMESCQYSNITPNLVQNFEDMRNVSSSFCAEEVKLETDGEIDLSNDPSLDLEDINDILAALGQHFGNLGNAVDNHSNALSSMASQPVYQTSVSQNTAYPSTFARHNASNDCHRQMALQSMPKQCVSSYMDTSYNQPLTQDCYTQNLSWQRQHNGMVNLSQEPPLFQGFPEITYNTC